VSSGVETRTISVGNGRELCVELAGDPHGKPILVHNGTPNSRHLYGRWIADADKKGIRLISYDRPGYGGSTAHPGHTVASGAQDVRVIAEALPQAHRHLPGLTESLLGAQGDELPGRVRAEEVREDPLRRICVVHEQEQVAQAEQGIRTGRGRAKGAGPAVHIADHMHPHDHRLEAIGGSGGRSPG